MSSKRFFFIAVACIAIVIGHAAADQPAATPGVLRFDVGSVDTTVQPNLKNQPPAAFDPDRIYVVQLASPITLDTRQRLNTAGVVLLDYIPMFAYAADLSQVQPNFLAADPAVAWIGTFQSKWKLEPTLGTRLFVTPERQAMAAAGDVSVVVTLFEGRGPQSVMDAVNAAAGGELLNVGAIGSNVVVWARLPLEAAKKLADLDVVQFVEDAPEVTLRNSSTRWIVQSNSLNVTPIWARGIIGTGQIVGVMDGAVDRNHCSMIDTTNNTPGPSHRKIVAYNGSFGSDTHGTHVGDTAIGQDVGGGTGDTRGMAYGGRLVWAPIPSFNETAMNNALTLHHNQGARVHTNSWGDDGTTAYNSLCRGIDVFSYNFEDDLVLFAVTNQSALKNPENAKNLIGVGASQDTPNQANHCSGGTGPTADSRRKPEIYAPGCGTTSAAAGSSCGTTSLTGTSMASPAVAGVGLLVREYYTSGFYPTGAAVPTNAISPSGALVKATLTNACVDMTGVSGYPSNQEGWGRLLLDNALYFNGDVRTLAVLADVRNASGYTTGQFQEYNINVTGTAESLRITLVWTEPAASAGTGTGFASINDMDLEVVRPGGTLFRGNVFSGGQSASGGTKDDRNNVEQVHVLSPILGTWIVRVRAAAVNQGTQGYALVATGQLELGPPDCNTNGTPDPSEIGSPQAPDCNSNDTIDVCDIAVTPAIDCDTNRTPDACDLYRGGPDCNTNARLDPCDMSSGAADCNTSGVMDVCEIMGGQLVDDDADGIPDLCDNCRGLSNPDQNPWLDRAIQAANAGQYGSLAVDPIGRVGLSYYRITNVSPARGELRLWLDLDDDLVAQPGELRVIDATTANVGQFTSMRFDASGRAMIAYHDVSNRDLKFWHDADGDDSASTGEISVLDTENNTGQNNSLRLDPQGRATLAYFRVTNNALKLWHDADGNFSLDAGELTVIDGNDPSVPGGENAGQYCSLAFDSAGRAAVSYYHNETHALKLWVDVNTNYSRDADEFTVIDGSADVGRYTSIAFDAAGRATVAYYDYANSNLKLWHDANGNLAFDTGEIVTIDSAGDVGQFASLAFDAAGRTMAAYYRADTGDLKLWRDANGNFIRETSEVSFVRSTGDVGSHAAMLFHPTRFTPIMAYRDATNQAMNITLQLDWDGDGNCFTADNCPGVFNPDQADADTNGTGDACEMIILACGDRARADVNGDQSISNADVSLFVAILLDPNAGTPAQRCAADVNGDSMADGLDVAAFIDLMLP